MKVCVYCLPYSLRLDSVVMPLILPDCLKEFVSCLLPPHTFRLNYTINKLNGADTGIKREEKCSQSTDVWRRPCRSKNTPIILCEFICCCTAHSWNYQTDQYDIGEPVRRRVSRSISSTFFSKWPPGRLRPTLDLYIQNGFGGMKCSPSFENCSNTCRYCGMFQSLTC